MGPNRYLPVTAWLACGWLGLGCLCQAQDPQPKSKEAASDAAESAAQSNATDWAGLASTLEQRLARILPCDPRIQASIDEVAKASSVRITALIADRKSASEKSLQQIESLKKLLSDHTVLAEKWKGAQSILETEGADIKSQTASLSAIASQNAALAPALKSLQAIEQSTQDDATVATRVQNDWTALSTSISDWIVAAQGRQSVLEREIKALETEGQNWQDYYAARSARAKAECSVLNPTADAEKRPKRTKRATKSKKAK